MLFLVIVPLLLILIICLAYMLRLLRTIDSLRNDVVHYADYVKQLKSDREYSPLGSPIIKDPRKDTTTRFRQRMQAVRSFDHIPTPPTGQQVIGSGEVRTQTGRYYRR